MEVVWDGERARIGSRHRTIDRPRRASGAALAGSHGPRRVRFSHWDGPARGIGRSNAAAGQFPSTPHLRKKTPDPTSPVSRGITPGPSPRISGSMSVLALPIIGSALKPTPAAESVVDGLYSGWLRRPRWTSSGDRDTTPETLKSVSIPNIRPKGSNILSAVLGHGGRGCAQH